MEGDEEDDWQEEEWQQRVDEADEKKGEVDVMVMLRQPEPILLFSTLRVRRAQVE